MKEQIKRIQVSLRDKMASVITRLHFRMPRSRLSQTKLAIARDVVRRHWSVGVGLLAALIAFFATQQYAENRVNAERDRLLPRGGLVEVLVASRDLWAGELASPVTVAIRQVPREWVLPNTLTPQDFDTVIDRAFVHSVSAGNPLLAEHLRQPDRQKVGFQIENGYRAVSISVDEVSSVGGLIQPGDFVDLWGSPLPKSFRKTDPMINLGAESGTLQQQARLIAENLRVLATGQNINRREATPTGAGGSAVNAAYSSITLAVPSKIANLVLGGQFQGRLGIALRSGTEESTVPRAKRTASRSKSVIPPPVEILVGGVEGGEE
jgi:pilus assembly protein CpaB